MRIRRALKALLQWTAIIAASALCAFALWIGGLALFKPPRLSDPPPSVVQADAKRGYVMRPNVDVDLSTSGNMPVAFVTDGAGLRVERRGQDVMAAELLFIGDSQTFSAGVPYAETFPALVGVSLGLSVANAGVGGYGPVSMLRQMQAFAYLKPRIVVFGHYYDHLDRAVSPCNPGTTYPCIGVPYIRATADRMDIVEPPDNEAVFALERRFRGYAAGKDGFSFADDVFWTARAFIGEIYFTRWGRRAVAPADAPRLAEFLYRRIAETARGMNARLLVLYIPDYFGEGRRIVPPSAFLKAAVELEGAAFVDPTPDLQDMKTRGGLNAIMIPNDGHLNAAAHLAVATRLIEAIKRAN